MSCVLETAAEPSSRRAVTRLRAGQLSQADDELAEEVPVALEYNGISHAVMMATPSDLEEFALGFSLSEGIIGSAREFYGAEVEHGAAGITLHIDIAAGAFAGLKDRRRNMSGRTGCGLCGVDSLAQVLRPLPWLAPGRALSARAIRHALAAVKAHQPLNRITGATHAALWCGRDGAPAAAFEDVGRHNALDKLIGSRALGRLDAGDGFALITSRASVEMVQKAATAGIAALVAISAPTALAARTATVRHDPGRLFPRRRLRRLCQRRQHRIGLNMNVDNLVAMANQIGAFFESCPDRAEASVEIATHLKRYWAPRMRSQLLLHIDRQQGEGLSALVLSALTAHRALLAPL